METLLSFYGRFYSFLLLITDFLNTPMKVYLKKIAFEDLPILGDLTSVIVDAIFVVLEAFGIPSDVTLFSGLFGSLIFFVLGYRLFKFLMPT